MPFTGTIVPGYNVELGMNTVSGNNLPVVGLQSVTDGTSNTGLFSERLISAYPFGVDRRPFIPMEPTGIARSSQGTYAAAPSSVSPAQYVLGESRAIVRAGVPVDR